MEPIGSPLHVLLKMKFVMVLQGCRATKSCKISKTGRCIDVLKGSLHAPARNLPKKTKMHFPVKFSAKYSPQGFVVKSTDFYFVLHITQQFQQKFP